MSMILGSVVVVSNHDSGDQTTQLQARTASYLSTPNTYEALAESYAAEISVAVNPTNPKNVVIAHNYFQGLVETPISYSTDGGYSWHHGAVGQYLWGDPFLSFDGQGNLYYLSMNGLSQLLQVSKSTDGGASFAPYTTIAKVNDPVRFQTGGSANGVLLQTYLGDFCKIGCDQTNSPYRNSVYVVFDGYVCTDGDGTPEYFGELFTKSTNGGLTWSTLMPISARASRDTPHGQLAMNIGIGVDGTIYIAMEAGEWTDLAQGSPYIVKSTDGGRTFTAPVAIFPNPSAFGLLYFHRFPVLVPSPTLSNKVYLAFTAQMQNSIDHDIFVSRSDDTGVTWQAPVRVNDDPVNNGVLQRNQFMSVSSDGRLDITWWDHRFGTRTFDADMYYAYSTNDAAGFSQNVRLTAATTGFDTHSFSNDYSTTASLRGEVLAAYAYPQPGAPDGNAMNAYVNHIYLSPVHNVNSNAYFATIQEAVNAASPNDVIEVSPGTYGLINVDRPLTIISTNGPDLTTIDGGAMTSDSVYVTANNVRIEGFTIENGDSGVSLNGCSGAVVIGNNIVQNGLAGVRIYGASNNEIVGNKISTPLNCGILIDMSGSPSYNTISNNLISDCVAAIYLQSGNQNLLTHNSIVGNEYGVILYLDSADNIIHHNSFVGNAFQALDSTSGINYWDDGVSAGNYWSDYAGHDSNGDGIGDTPYLIPDTGKQDRYPLMTIQGPRLTVLAVDENGQSLPGMPVSIDQSPAGTTGGTFTVLHGSHSVGVIAEWITAGKEYAFLKWSDGTEGTSRTGKFYGDQTLTAQYAREKVQNANTGQYYLTVREAVSAASAGNTILIGAGTYLEGVTIPSSKTGLILRGESASTTVMDCRMLSIQATVSAEASGVLVEKLTLKSHWNGVEVRSSAVTVRDNIISDCRVDAILSVGATSFVIANNQLERCGYGIEAGVYSGLMTTGGSISGNVIQNNGIGLMLTYCRGVVITENKIQNNNVGILLGRNSTTVAGYADANAIYHNNFVSNTMQAKIQSIATVTNNLWDNGLTSGGNYWSDYVGTDSNGDGFGDTPYVVNTNNKDNYPLMSPWGETPPTTFKLTVQAKVGTKALNGITVTIDGSVAGTTPVTKTLAPGSYTVSVPLAQTIGRTTYHFVKWLDTGSTNPTRTVTLQSDTTLTAVYIK